MKTFAPTLCAISAAALLVAPSAAADDDRDWTGGRPLPPGTEVPFEPGYATQWRSYDVVRPGDPNFRNVEAQGVRVLGRYDSDSMLCLMNAKGGQWGCYVNGEKATELGYTGGGKVVTVDPVVETFAPVIRFFLSVQSRFASLSS